MHGVQKVIHYMLMHDLTIIALQALYKLAPSIFSI
jgi:hypothetical protein